MKKNKAKRSLALLIALLMMGSTVVFGASQYSFTFQDVDRVKYSSSSLKTAGAASFYVRQTGSSPGVYQVRYTVVTSALINASLSKTVSGTDYTGYAVSYLSNYASSRHMVQLKGEYLGDTVHTVNGEWNPVP